MIRHAFERGVASVIARWMLEGRHEAIFRSIERAGALPPEEIATLRDEVRVHLEHVRDEGAPYADMLVATAGEMLPAVTELARGARSAALNVAAQALRSAGDAVAAAGERSGAAPADKEGGQS